MEFRRASACLGLAASVALLPGCERRSADRSDAGDAPARRLVVLSPALAETLRDLGQGDRIVGRHGWDSYTPSTVPAVGNEHGIDYEGLLKVRPTHVVMQAGAKEPPARLVELASLERWEIVRVPALTLDDVSESIWALAAAAGMRGAEAGVLRASFRSAFERDAGLPSRAGRTLVLAGVDPPAVMGPGSFHFEMIERIGADAVPDQGSAFIQWGVEDVLKCDPDTIVLMLPGASSKTDAEYLGPLARVGLRCVSRGAVVVETDPKGHLPATSLAPIARRLREKLGALPLIETPGRAAQGTP